MEVINDQNNEQTTDPKNVKIELGSLPTKDLEYTEPIWARVPTCSKDSYYIEVIKEGTVIDRISLYIGGSEKSYFAIGRFDPCEIKLEHPSVSRFHSVLQYGEFVRGKPQWFIYDMNSTHGVRVNKKRIEKLTFVPLLAGYVFQIAASSRIFVLCGGPTEEYCESEMDIKKITKEDNSKLKIEDSQNNKKEGDDAELSNYRYYEKDPIHWLERYFEREGAPMNFRFTKSVEGNDYLGLGEKSKKSRGKDSKDDDGSSTWICSIELIDDVSLTGGTLVSASAPSKQLAHFQCSLLACERLDAACLLQISTLWNKRKKFAENDFYEEDEDLFYDRTGQLEEQREKRKRWCEGDFGSNQKAKTHKDLMKEIVELNEKLLVVREEIERLNGRDSNECLKDNEEGTSIQRSFSMRMAISQLKTKEKNLLEKRNKTARLAEIVKPLFGGGSLNKEIKEFNEEKNTTNIVEEEYKVEDKEINEIVTKKEIVKDESNKEIETSILPLQDEGHSKKRKISNQTNKKVEEEIKKEEEPKFYAPLMPPKSAIASITPRFGVLTKQELIQMKMIQSKEEGNKEALLEKRQRLLLEREEIKKRTEENEQILNNSEDKYATWLPPEDQSGDGSTKLNRKFDGKY